jgi:transposase
MSNIAVSKQAFCGIDVSAATLAVAVQRPDRNAIDQREFPNSAPGHRQLILWLGKLAVSVRVSLEATGVYSLDLALALDAAQRIELAVLNPNSVNHFAKTLRRSKTDKADALVLAEYSLRMPFTPWRRPDTVTQQICAIGRYIATITQEHTRLSNRLHAANAAKATPKCVRQDLKRAMQACQKRIQNLRKQALKLIQQNPELKQRFKLLLQISGIAETSAIHLLSQIAPLDPKMTVRQWVAHSGLDPAHRTSGTSVNLPSRISRHGNKHLRRALYMPALVATRHDPYFRAFYQELQARHKTKLQALMAVARKLLHAIYGIFKTNTPYDGAKLFPQQKRA